MKTGDYSLPSTAWQSDISLDYNATYYWKVRASGSNSYSAWSAVGGFTTQLPLPEPSPSSTTQNPSSPSSPSPPVASPPVPSPTESPASSGPSSSLPLQSSLPGWVIYLVGALLLVILLLLIILLMLVVRIRRF